MAGVVSEADLREQVTKQAGQILDAIIVARDRPLEPVSYVCHVRCSWSEADFLAIARFRNTGLRTHKSIEPFRRLLEEHQYRGRIALFNEDDPALARLHLTGIDPMPYPGNTAAD